MRTRVIQLVVAYLLAGFIFILYTLRYVNECEAYWAHDFAITITPGKILIEALLFFFLPALLLLMLQYLQVKLSLRFFRVNLIAALLLMLLIAFIIPHPGQTDGSFIFISIITAILYYLLQLVCWSITGFLFFKTIILIAARKKT
jgi:hypothetical protein